MSNAATQVVSCHSLCKRVTHRHRGGDEYGKLTSCHFNTDSANRTVSDILVWDECFEIKVGRLNFCFYWKRAISLCKVISRATCYWLNTFFQREKHLFNALWTGHALEEPPTPNSNRVMALHPDAQCLCNLKPSVLVSDNWNRWRIVTYFSKQESTEGVEVAYNFHQSCSYLCLFTCA